MSIQWTRWVLGAGTSLVLIAAMMAWNPSEGYQSATAATDYQQLDKFAQIMDAIRKSYVREVADEELIEGALSGMLSSLDPHSTYLDKEMYKQMQVDTSGEFGGLGIEISSADGGIRIVTPIEDTPADKAGVLAGDLIVKINDELAKDMSLPEAVKKMRGKPGSGIDLTIFREGENEPVMVHIVRAVIHVKSVKSGLLAPGYVWLRVTQFQENSTAELKKQFAVLKKEAEGNIQGAVLDLRNNPGGLLDQAVGISDLFLNSGEIVSTQSRVGSSLNFKASKGDILQGVPLIVLINNGSASASEIVSGALQDNKRGLLLGTKSFGKGSVQRVIPLPDGTAFKLTTALYYTPSGRSIQATGIEPDVLVEQVRVTTEKAKKRVGSISERNLKGHLENGNKSQHPMAKRIKAVAGKVSKYMQERLEKDVQLQRALDVLKAMHVFMKG